MTRFRCARTTAALGAVLCVVVLLLPVLVSAESQTVVTEYANFQPYADNNDEVVNIANETIRTNIDTWNPRPSGVFVGGTIEESLLRLNEVGTSSRNWLMVTTVVQFDEAYTMNGASQCIVRLPMYVDDEPSNQTQADLWIYRLATVAAPSFGFNSTTAEPVVTSATNLVARYENIARIYAHDSDAPIWRDMSRESWLSEHRLYVRLIAPLLSGVPYLLVARMFVPAGVPFDVYFHPSDLCSDSILMTRIVYSWMQAPDRLYYQVRPVEADAGWSFVFQQGLGGMGMVYDHYFYATQMIVFDKWVRVNDSNATGPFTFAMSFRQNYTEELNYTLDVTVLNETGVTTHYLLRSTWWHHKSAHGFLCAASNIGENISAQSVDGDYYVHLRVRLTINNATRLQLAGIYEDEVPSNASFPHNRFQVFNTVMGIPGSYPTDTVWFALFCSAIFGRAYNDTTAAMLRNEAGFLAWAKGWWDRHWMDVLGALLIVGGALMTITGVGAVFGVPLMAAGVGMILYNNWPTFRNFVNNLIKMIIDGLEWLGNWLYKIGMAIWKALTWLVDQVVYYGAILLGMFIIAVAIALFVGPIYAEIKILGAFLMMAQGDYDKAAAQLGGLISQGRELVRR